MSKDPLVRAVPLLVELQEAVRGGNQLLKDLKRERNAIKELLDRIPEKAEEAVDELVREQIEHNIAAMGDGLKTTMDEAVNRINGTFDRITRLLSEITSEAAPQSRMAMEETFRAAADELARQRLESDPGAVASRAPGQMVSPKRAKRKCGCGREH